MPKAVSVDCTLAKTASPVIEATGLLLISRALGLGALMELQGANETATSIIAGRAAHRSGGAHQRIGSRATDRPIDLQQFVAGRQKPLIAAADDLHAPKPKDTVHCHLERTGI